jgi:hypothetical protein
MVIVMGKYLYDTLMDLSNCVIGNKLCKGGRSEQVIIHRWGGNKGSGGWFIVLQLRNGDSMDNRSKISPKSLVGMLLWWQKN